MEHAYTPAKHNEDAATVLGALNFITCLMSLRTHSRKRARARVYTQHIPTHNSTEDTIVAAVALAPLQLSPKKKLYAFHPTQIHPLNRAVVFMAECKKKEECVHEL